MQELILLTKYYDPLLVIASIIVACAGSYASLEMNQRLARNNEFKWSILLIASCTMGLSIWAMHFIGMASFSIPIEITYHWGLTFLSIVPAIFSAFIAFFTLYRFKPKPLLLLIAGLVMGGGITSMHYIGMSAIQFPGILSYRDMPLLLSIVIAVAVSFVALYLFRVLQKINTGWVTVPVAIVMGLAISGMHYTGMVASEFCLPIANQDLLGSSPVRSREFLGTISGVIVGAAIIVLIVYLQSERRFFNGYCTEMD
ncbi:MHYT domain-containing protein [Bacillus suaedae]|uniref:MHYT domain-containing protein n=1 Tax=Halalkalibacter suaedae TaxID=2822140 RepID=A0A941AQL4_9BACI|nr:MHYT domain-containing protein [Bacillus suaedae]MBP3951358.1 hypothetical protein [Bacillus suaedae]